MVIRLPGWSGESLAAGSWLGSRTGRSSGRKYRCSIGL